MEIKKTKPKQKKIFFSQETWGRETNEHPLNGLTNTKSIVSERLAQTSCLSLFQFAWRNWSKRRFIKPTWAPLSWAFGVTNVEVNAGLIIYFCVFSPLLDNFSLSWSPLSSEDYKETSYNNLESLCCIHCCASVILAFNQERSQERRCLALKFELKASF